MLWNEVPWAKRICIKDNFWVIYFSTVILWLSCYSSHYKSEMLIFGVCLLIELVTISAFNSPGLHLHLRCEDSSILFVPVTIVTRTECVGKYKIVSGHWNKNKVDVFHWGHLGDWCLGEDFSHFVANDVSTGQQAKGNFPNGTVGKI